MTLTKNAIGMLVAKYKAVLKNMLIKNCIAILVCAVPASSLAAEVTVTNINDSGSGSLRNAIVSASSHDTISFAGSLNGKTISLGSTITIDKNLSFAVPDHVTVTIDGTNSVGPLLSGNANTVLDFSGAGLVIQHGENSQIGISATALGGGMHADSITTFSGKLIGNTVSATGETGYAYATGGGVFAGESIDTLSGQIINNNAIAASGEGSAIVYGGGVRVWDNMDTLSGQVSGNKAEAVSNRGDAQASGGGVDLYNSITTLSGEVSGNTVLAQVKNDSFFATADADGGGVRAYNITAFSGKINDNSASAINATRDAKTRGGGLFTGGIDTLSGQISGNTALALSNTGSAIAVGGGAYIHSPSDITIRQGLFENNRAIASGNEDSFAAGGALFLNTTTGPVTVTLAPTDGDIIFRNNTVTTNGKTTANDITFGSLDNRLYFSSVGTLASSSADASLKIGDGPNHVYLTGGVTVNMDNGKSFAMVREGSSGSGNFFWGGNNIFTTNGGTATVHLASGTTTLEQGFNLEGNNLSFTLGQDALLQVKPTLQPATINAASITLEAGSRLAMNDSSFVYGPVLTLGQNHTLLTMHADSFNDQTIRTDSQGRMIGAKAAMKIDKTREFRGFFLVSRFVIAEYRLVIGYRILIGFL